MIREIHFKNFRALKDVKTDLEQFTLFVGPNGSGKTSCLKAIDLLCSLGELPIVKLPDTYHSEMYTKDRQPNEARQFTIEVPLEHRSMGFHFFLPPNEEETRVVMSSQPPPSFIESYLLTPSPQQKKQTNEECIRLYSDFRRDSCPSLLLSLNASEIASKVEDVQAIPHFDPSGRGLPLVLDSLQQEDPDSFEAIQIAMRRIITGFRRFYFVKSYKEVVEPLPVSVEGETHVVHRRINKVARQLYFDMWDFKRLSAESISEGTLFVLGILAAIHQTKRPRLLLIDDIDGKLHPVAQTELVKVLRQILGQFPGLQLIATTHSPEMARCFSADEIRLMNVDENGYAICKQLTDHPEYEKWKDSLDPGEFWASVGEDWILPRPATVNEAK